MARAGDVMVYKKDTVGQGRERTVEQTVSVPLGEAG